MSNYEHVGRKIVCHQCDGLYHPLGFMRHRTAHRERRAEIAKLRERLDSGKYDTAELIRYEKLIVLEPGV